MSSPDHERAMNIANVRLSQLAVARQMPTMAATLLERMMLEDFGILARAFLALSRKVEALKGLQTSHVDVAGNRICKVCRGWWRDGMQEDHKPDCALSEARHEA